MRKISLILVLIFLSSCKDEKPSSKEVVVSNKTSIEVPIINYEELDQLLNQKNGKTYIVNFWATWCKPCVEELPAFEKLYHNYKNENVELILVSLDFPKQLEKRVIPFIKEHQLKGSVYLMGDPDQNTWIPKVSPEWSGAIPATVIYNKKNRDFYEQSFSYEALETELNKFLPSN